MRAYKSIDLEKENYYRVPKWVMDMFLEGKISSGAYKTYVLMYERLRVSSKNNWVNDDGEIYIKYSYDEMLEDLKCNSKTTVSNNIKELIKLGMIVQKKKFNASSCYFLTYFESTEDYTNVSTENCNSTEACTTTKDCTAISTEDCTYTSTENCTHTSTENLYASKNNVVRITKSKNNFSKNNVVSVNDTHEEEIDKESVEFKNNIIELRNIIKKSTGVAMQYIEGQMNLHLYKDIIKELLIKIKSSKYLMGEKEEKPKIFMFTSKTGISKIMAGNYDDFEKKKPVQTKIVNFNSNNPYDTRTPKQIEEDRKRQEAFEKAIGIGE